MELCFKDSMGNQLEMIMNMNCFREGRVPTSWSYVENNGSIGIDKEGDLMDDIFFKDLDQILNMF